MLSGWIWGLRPSGRRTVRSAGCGRAYFQHGRVRRRKGFVEDGSVDYAVPRFLVRQELRRIWECQRVFYPQLLTEELRQEVTELIFRDRPRAPYAVGLCSLDPDSGERRLPRMHRLAELRRIYEQINNIRFRTATAFRIFGGAPPGSISPQ